MQLNLDSNKLNRMQSKKVSFTIFQAIALSLALSIHMNAYAGLFWDSTDSWKEEVLLHDGGKLIVERSVSRGGRHEIGQSSPISEQSIRFKMPGTSERVIWEDKFSKDVDGANFLLVQLDVLNKQAYLTTSPAGCLSYNKWDRPNPPYVIFNYKDKEWKRIPLHELPSEFKMPNLIISSPDTQVKRTGLRFISAEMIREMNSGAIKQEFKTIVREPVYGWPSGTNCEKMIPYGGGGWLGFDWFTAQPTYEACSNFCIKQNVSVENCPCKNIFSRK